MNIKRNLLILSIFLLIFITINMQVVHSEVKDNQFINHENEFNNYEDSIYIENNIMEESLTTNNNLGFIEYGNEKYYLDQYYVMVIGEKYIDNKWYYFHANGQMARFTFINYPFFIDISSSKISFKNVF